jgi:excisionase family DNA binding protein
MTMTAALAAELRDASEDIRDRWPRAAEYLENAVRTGRAQIEPEAEYLTTAQAARLLHVTDQTVRNWVDRGWLDGCRVEGGRRMIPASALRGVVAFERSRRVAMFRGAAADEQDVAEVLAAVRSGRGG